MIHATHLDGGFVWALDADGRLVNPASPARLQPPYRQACTAACTALRAIMGNDIRAIHVRGSAAIGRAIPPFSDLDLLVVTHRPWRGSSVALHDRLMADFPFLESVDIGLIPQDEIGATPFGRKVRSYLQVEAACLWGEDLAHRWTRPKPDADLARVRFPGLVAELEGLDDILSGAAPAPAYRDIPRPAAFWAKWAMRMVLRATHLLSMLETRAYTNDLSTCQRLAAAHFPAFRPMLGRAGRNERQAESCPLEARFVLRWFLDVVAPIWSARVEPAPSLQVRTAASPSSMAPSMSFTSLPMAMKL